MSWLLWYQPTYLKLSNINLTHIFFFEISPQAKSMYPSVPVLVYGGLCLLAIFIAILLPETADEELPQTIEEANSFGIHQTYLHCIICPQRKGKLTFCCF